MHTSVELWFLVSALVALLYSWRAGETMERLFGRRQLGLVAAVFCFFGITGMTVALTYVDVSGAVGLKRPDIARVLLGATATFIAAQLAMQFWVAHRLWRRYSAMLTGLLVFCFYAKPGNVDVLLLNNLLVMLIAVGIGSYIVHRASVPFSLFIFAALCCFDVYAVWFSDIMVTLANQAGDSLPGGFFVMMQLAPGDSLGAGDVIFGVTGVMLVGRHACRGLAVSAALTITMLLWILGHESTINLLPAAHQGYLLMFPAMLIISPVIITCLLIGRKKVT